MSSDAMSEQSSVREGTGYDEAFGLGIELEDFSPSSGRETSAQSLDGEDECYAEDLEIEVGKENWIDRQVLEITVPLFFSWSGLSTSFYRQ